MTPARANLFGFGAVLLWAMLALLTIGTGDVPPFQLNAMCFTVGALVGGIWVLRGKGGFRRLGQVGWRVWLLGVVGLFGYHFFYFTALRLAPPAEASLIAYLWPLLIVLFSGLLPGERLRPSHILGALLAFGGAVLLVGGNGDGFASEHWVGYLAACVCALTWSGYSVLSRLAGNAPTESVAGFCLAAAGLSVVAHLSLETTVWPDGALQWVSIGLLGLGPVGLAFYLWDVGMKRGNIQVLGTASYAAPLLSTFILIAVGLADASPSLLIAAALIAGGALIAARS